MAPGAPINVRRGRAGLALMMRAHALVIVALGLVATTSGVWAAPSPSSSLSDDDASDPVDGDFHQCDRECRYRIPGAFYDRRVTGRRSSSSGHDDAWGSHCRCYRGGAPVLVNGSAIIERTSKKAWDSTEFWCGPGDEDPKHPGFNTQLVCVLDAAGSRGVRTTTRARAEAGGHVIVHCGQCAACSRPSDVRVLYDTRTFITTRMTRCATEFAKPKFLGGNRDLDALRACLLEANIPFDDTDASRFGAYGPTCMDCWTDNIMCDAAQCSTNPDCIEKFIDPSNTGAFAGCLKCDETHCGAEFIRCAGANRRSSGVLSDIIRPTNGTANELCWQGIYGTCSSCLAMCNRGTPSEVGPCKAACQRRPECAAPFGGDLTL